ncbi:DNA-binding HORMA domain-containing protein [Heterostelium album PN500]|uniref:DNA-binding HORMA domain-containing protein n=1 Tax=Heterostelium pallidum (strain ATCC 26659 / Pp 5 / PN500) TaxID=670386 RepID=D3B5F9_HETP5|nr:DNA-binding HORMA domain-containing protein [Heterostelium album PN500]EFA83107.1 DNA-binding HORMA domain-containing protein [Heterostelium album PN500]|eukprot:XP_020435224.1 DNA-binding HORMA domain-containing protein [Heterostelium album PN500]
MMQSLATKNNITLKGSTDIVTEFFSYSINSILFQRGVYPPETFSRVAKYGLSILVTTDQGLKDYLDNVLKQLSQWLMTGDVQKLVLVITDVVTKDVLERWVFDVQTDLPNQSEAPRVKPEKEIMNEIQAIIRQITASVTFLPLLPSACTFDLLVYTNKDISVPQKWEESDPQYITNSQHVRLRSFTTTIHKVDTMVAYKLG